MGRKKRETQQEVVEQLKPNVTAVCGDHAEVRDPAEDSRGGSRYRGSSAQLEQASQGLADKNIVGKQGVLVTSLEPGKTEACRLETSLVSPRSSSSSLSVVVWTEEILKAFHSFLVSLVNGCMLTVPSLLNQPEEVGVWSDKPAEDVCNESWGRCGDEPHKETAGPGWSRVLSRRDKRHKRQLEGASHKKHLRQIVGVN